MQYKKEYIKPDGRKLTGSGPRDLQKRQQQINNIDQNNIIKELKKEINRLSKELREQQPVKGYSGEEMDNKIRSTVIEAVKDLKEEIKNYRKQEKQFIIDLERRDKELEEIKEKHNKEIKNLLKKHSEKLEELTISIIKSGVQKQEVEDYYKDDRPKIEAVFIDPLEKNDGETLEPFLDTKDVSIDEQENMFNKIDKLKGILGKLPFQK